MTVKMEVIYPALQVHGENQTHQTQIMVTMEMTDKDVVYPMEVCLHSHELHLRAFSTVDQK